MDQSKEEKLIPMTDIRIEVREIAVSWAESNDYHWIGDKHKLASDIQNYADGFADQQVRLNSDWYRVEDKTPDNEFWYRVQVDGKHHILPHCYMGGSWWCYGSSCPDESNVTHWQEFVDV